MSRSDRRRMQRLQQQGARMNGNGRIINPNEVRFSHQMAPGPMVEPHFLQMPRPDGSPGVHTVVTGGLSKRLWVSACEQPARTESPETEN